MNIVAYSKEQSSEGVSTASKIGMKWTRVQSTTNDDFPAKIQDQLIDEDRAYWRRKQN